MRLSRGKAALHFPDHAIFPGGLAQSVVDTVLPAGAALPEKFQHILIDAQRHLFLHARNDVLLWRRGCDLGGNFLERRFRLAARVVPGARTSRLIGHFMFPSCARLSDDVPKAGARLRYGARVFAHFSRMQALMFRKWLQIAIRNNAQKSRSLRRKTSDQIE